MQRNIFEGSEFLLFDIDQNPIAYCKNSAIKINRNLSDVTTKDSEGWNDFINGVKSWSLDFEGLVSYDDTSFSTSYFLSKFKHSEPFFISFGIIQDDFTHTFWGEVAIESIEINSDNGEIVSYSGSLKGVGKLAFTNEGTPEQSGYIKTETDPYFRSSAAHSITNSNIINWIDAYNNTLNEVLFNTIGNTTTLNVKLRDGSIYSSSFNHIGGGSGGTILTGLTFNSSNGQLSVNNLSTSLDGRFQPLGSYVSQSYLNDNYYSNSQADSRFATNHYVDTELANLVNAAPSTLDTLNELADALGNDHNFATTITSLIGTKANSDDVYSKLVSDGRYKAIDWLPNWSEVSNRPIALSQFTNDLGLNLIYQPLENQRLSTTNNVIFNQITANSKLNIPSTSSNKYSIYVDENGVGGEGEIIPVISYLNDLQDVTITSPVNGNVLMFNGTQWINSTVTSGTFNYNDLINKPTLLSQFTNDLGNYGNWITAASLPDLSPYALANGSNSSGNWNINISGIAKYWGNDEYGAEDTPANYFMTNIGGGKWGYRLKADVKNDIGLDNGATLNNNITGEAGSVTNGVYNDGGVYNLTSTYSYASDYAVTSDYSNSAGNSLGWNNQYLDFSTFGTSLNFFLGFDGVAGKTMPFNPSQAAIAMKAHIDIGFNGGYPSSNANTVAENTSSFTYANNAPLNGYLGYFGNGGYGLQLNSSYSSAGGSLFFRTRNGDAGNFNDWKELIYNSGTWDINISGVAANATTWGSAGAYNGTAATSPALLIGWENSAWRPVTPSILQSTLNIGDGSTLANNISGTAARANLLKASNAYPSVITDSTTAESLVEGSFTRVDFHENVGAFGSGYANTITTSSYDRYAATQISSSYNALVPRMAIRNFNQSLNDWNNWVEVLTTGNGGLQKITDIGNTTTNSIQAARLSTGYDSGVAGSINTNDYLRVAGNGGVHWATYGIGFEGYSAYGVSLAGNQATTELRMVTAGGATRGYLYADNGNNIGLLNSAGTWALRLDNNGTGYFGGNVEANAVYANNWFRSFGATGWLNESYGGGMYMLDSTYVRVYGGKQFYAENWIGSTDGFLAHNYGAGLVGQYSATKYQSVFSMGAPYIMSVNGSGLANHYGIAWTHENIGGQSKAGLGHQMLITEAGVTQTALGNGIWTRANIFAAGTIEAPTIKANNSLQIPAKNSAGTPTGNHFSIWVEV
ncbi:hypothetical protein EON78_00085 [bacterium]|nr:MAG: hypothetical protein EON78_00085 [bacterium]